MYAMQCNCSVVGIPDRVTPSIWLLHSSDHVEVNRVTTQFKGLSNISELYVLNSSNWWLISRWVNHDVGTILVSRRGLRISSVNNVSWQQTYFTGHRHFNSTILRRLREMLVVERLLKCNSLSVCNSLNDSCFRLIIVVARRRNHNSFANFPIYFISQLNWSGIHVCSSRQSSPSDTSRDSVHLQLTKTDTNNFVSIYR